MKKNLLWIALGVATMTGCTSTEVMDEGIQSNAIGFENVVKKGTRADEAVNGDLNNTNFNKFCVYGYYTKNNMEAHPIQVFYGDEVSKKGGTWTYDTPRYWMPDSKYYFYAYSCADIALGEGKGTPVMNLPTDGKASDRTLKIIGYVCNSEHQHDLVADAAEAIPGTNTDNTKVKFSFSHALCKVSAQFVNDLPAGYDAIISGVKIINFYDKGNLDIHDNFLTWDSPSRTTTEPEIPMTITSGDKATSTLAPREEGEEPLKVTVAPVFMLPVLYDNANVRIQFNLSVKSGDDVFLDRIIYGTWKPEWEVGKIYNYTIHITGNTAQLQQIEFEAVHAVNDLTNAEGWSSDINTDMTFSYN